MWYNDFAARQSDRNSIANPGARRKGHGEKTGKSMEWRTGSGGKREGEAQMKINRAGLWVLAVVVLALAVMGGFFLGRSTVADPIRIITRSTPQPSERAELDTSGSREIPASESGSPEGNGEEAAFPININTASAEELQALPGIGKTRAEAIVAYREEHGPFTYVEDLRGVSGIGEGILESIMDYITVGEQSNG